MRKGKTKHRETFLSCHMNTGCFGVCPGYSETSAACFRVFDLREDLGDSSACGMFFCKAANQSPEPTEKSQKSWVKWYALEIPVLRRQRWEALRSLLARQPSLTEEAHILEKDAVLTYMPRLRDHPLPLSSLSWG